MAWLKTLGMKTTLLNFFLRRSPPDHPIAIAQAFLMALDDPENLATLLQRMVTPESRPMWGDFYAASRWLDNAGDIGVGSVARHVAGIPDVRYVKLAAGITTGRIAKTLSEIDAAAYMTLIWRPESSF